MGEVTSSSTRGEEAVAGLRCRRDRLDTALPGGDRTGEVCGRVVLLLRDVVVVAVLWLLLLRGCCDEDRFDLDFSGGRGRRPR